MKRKVLIVLIWASTLISIIFILNSDLNKVFAQSSPPNNETYQFLREWGSYGNGDGLFNLPMGIAIDSDDNVYVVDPYVSNIQKFDNNGNFLSKFGSNGTADGQFILPTGIAIDSDKNLYVTDLIHGVQKFDNNGNFVSKLNSYFPDAEGLYTGEPYVKVERQIMPVGISIDSNDNFYVSDKQSKVLKFDSDGNFLGEWGSYGNGVGQFQSLGGIATDSSGDVYITDMGTSRIQVFAPLTEESETNSIMNEDRSSLKLPFGITDEI